MRSFVRAAINRNTSSQHIKKKKKGTNEVAVAVAGVNSFQRRADLDDVFSPFMPPMMDWCC